MSAESLRSLRDGLVRCWGRHDRPPASCSRDNCEVSRLVADITTLATKYGRYGYRRITALLNGKDWQVNYKRVERIWRQEGIKMPKKQSKRGRRWFNDGSCIRLRPEHEPYGNGGSCSSRRRRQSSVAARWEAYRVTGSPLVSETAGSVHLAVSLGMERCGQDMPDTHQV